MAHRPLTDAADAAGAVGAALGVRLMLSLWVPGSSKQEHYP